MDLLELLDGLNRRRCPSIVSLTTETEPDMLVKSRISGERNPLNGVHVVRIAQRRAIVGANYASCVDRQRQREFLDLPPFQADRLWRGYGVHIKDTILVTHKDKGGIYLPYRPHTVAGEVRTDRDLWLADGQAIDKPGPEWFSLRTSGKQGTVNTMPWRTVACENILQLRYARNEYNRD